jgi:hypothetical protein
LQLVEARGAPLEVGALLLATLVPLGRWSKLLLLLLLLLLREAR